jgi:ribonuclease P/MRP protein subunit POP5
MKRILPSLREKKRYIVFEILGNKINEKIAQKEINNSLLKFLGELTISRAQTKLITDSWKNNKGIIKVNIKYLNDTKLALGLIKQIDNKKVIVNVIGVSGILKKAKQKFVEG